MKKMILAFAVILVAFSASAQEAAKKAEDVVKFKETKFNFGKIKQGVPVTHAFDFDNVSEAPVTIENASASCGCTTPVWPQPPISKGKSDKITAGFNAASAGPFEKTIYVKVKGIDYPLELKIAGEVLNAEEFAKFETEKKNKKTSK